MTAREQLQCLLDNGFITQAQFNAAAKITAITNNLDASLLLAGSGEAQSTINLGPITEAVVINPGPAEDGISKVILTAHGNDVLFTIVDVDPAAGFGHILKNGVNVSMTKEEYDRIRLLALDNTSNASVTVTFYA